MPKDKIHVKADLKVPKTYLSLYVLAEDKNWWNQLRNNGVLKLSQAELFHKVMESARKRGAITK